VQSIEAMISLLVFLSLASLVLSAHPGPPALDDSLYRMQLAEDAWRLLYLRGNLRDLGPEKRAMVESDMVEIGKQTGFCIFMQGVEFTNCRGGSVSHADLISLRRTVLVGGQPTTVTFTISRRYQYQ